MKTVVKLPAKNAEDALRILDEAWAYYEPEPRAPEADAAAQEELFPYYQAA